MAHHASPSNLVGRRRERERLDRLVASLRGGQSRALVVRGEPGQGKTALLDDLAARAGGIRILRASGVESEMELAFAGLQQLCSPVLDGLDRLPEPQALTLGVALGLRSGSAPDRFLVGLAVLGLLGQAAEESPLLCIVDDGQWLDRASAQVLAFVARRLAAESVGIVLGVREPVGDDFAVLEDLIVPPLDYVDSRAVLEAVYAGPMDAEVIDRIVAEAHGNPLALVELHRAVGLDQVTATGEFGLSRLPAVGGRVERSFAQRIARLPPSTRTILLIAALEPIGDPTLVLAAASDVGLDIDAFAPAVEDDLIEIGLRVRFRHPLVRSAVVAVESADQRRAAHRALAAATDPVAEPDRRAWHRAAGTIGFDEEIALELVDSARRARRRGGLAAAAAFNARGAELTPDRRDRAARSLAAAEDMFRAGALQDATRLLDLADESMLDEHEQARVDLVRAHVAYNSTRGRDTPAILLAAARRIEPSDEDAALATYADAFIAALSAGSLSRGAGMAEVAARILAFHPSGTLSPASEAAALALHGLAVVATDGIGAAAGDLRTALVQLRETFGPTQADTASNTSASDEADPRRGLGADVSDEHGGLKWMPLACLVSRVLLDDAALDELSAEFVDRCFRVGALAILPLAVSERVAFLLTSGAFIAAETLAEQARSILAAPGSPSSMQRTGWISSFRGDERAKAEFTASLRSGVEERGEGQWFFAMGWLDGLLFNSLGRYAEAHAATAHLDEPPYDIGQSGWALPEQVEAAMRSESPESARRAVSRLEEIAVATGSDWAWGLAEQSAAMMADDEHAEELYRSAIERLARTRLRLAAGRARLLYGEWLRRQSRRVDAREQLRSAYEAFDVMGASAFAERARRELAATGEVVHRSAGGHMDELTAQERQIAQLAAIGHTNPEIGAQLYLSPRTVEWHLRKVFTKLGVTSRRQLASALRERGAAAPHG